MRIHKLAVAALLAVAACAGATKETKQPAQAGAAPATPPTAVKQGEAQTQQPSATAQAQGAAQTQTGKETTTKPQARTPPEKAATGATPAAETATTPPTQTTSAPPLMPEEAFRDQKPAPLPIQPTFQAPVPVQKKLKNGAKLLVVENHQLPLVSIDVLFLHGTDAEPIDKAGLAEFVAGTVDEGTKTRSATKFAEELENLAARLSASAGRETTSVHLNCLTDTLPEALDLLADMVQNPAFRKEDVERVRVLKLARLQQKLASPGALAGDEASRILYGDRHPWGQPAGGTPQTVSSITPADLAAFHAAWWVPNDAVISVSGDVKVAEIQKLLDDKLGAWKAKPLPKLALPALPNLDKRYIDALDKQGTTQSQVWVLGRMFPAKNPDAVPMRVANMTLGGLFSSRLNMNLREQHGYSYGVFSGLALMRSTGAIFAQGGIVAKNTVEAIAEYEKELDRFAKGDVSDDELVAAKQAFVRSIPSQLETNDAVSGAIAGLYSLGLPLDYYRTLPGKVQKLKKADISRVAKKWMKPAHWPVVVVGPIGSSKEGLEKLGLGPVEVKPAGTPSAPVAKPASAAAGTH